MLLETMIVEVVVCMMLSKGIAREDVSSAVHYFLRILLSLLSFSSVFVSASFVVVQ